MFVWVKTSRQVLYYNCTPLPYTLTHTLSICHAHQICKIYAKIRMPASLFLRPLHFLTVQGSGLTFCGNYGSSVHRKKQHTYAHVRGRAVLHLGRQRHGFVHRFVHRSSSRLTFRTSQDMNFIYLLPSFHQSIHPSIHPPILIYLPFLRNPRWCISCTFRISQGRYNYFWGAYQSDRMGQKQCLPHWCRIWIHNSAWTPKREREWRRHRPCLPQLS